MLENNRAKVDALNVFPVPDGDTGTNMSLTMQSAVKELNSSAAGDFLQVCDLISKGALRGARGNSGVILSQIFRGICSVLRTCKAEADTRTFAKAMEAGTKVAYSAVSIPKEGTILTVIRMMSEYAVKVAGKHRDFETFIPAVIAEGGESGGHVGELTTMVLVPQVCDATDLPVLAAGGIGDGRGIAAAFQLGAVGVQVGTRFLVAQECGVHPNYKKKVLKANDISTMVTGKRLGHPVRQIKNPFAKDFLKAEYSPISDEELEALGRGALYRAAVEGDEKTGDFLAGQIAGMVNKEQPAGEIIREMFQEAEEVLKNAGKWLA